PQRKCCRQTEHAFRAQTTLRIRRDGGTAFGTEFRVVWHQPEHALHCVLWQKVKKVTTGRARRFSPEVRRLAPGTPHRYPAESKPFRQSFPATTHGSVPSNG